MDFIYGVLGMFGQTDVTTGTRGVGTCYQCARETPMSDLFSCTTCKVSTATANDADYLFCGTCIAKKHKGHDYHEVDVHTREDTATTEADAWVLGEEGSVAKPTAEGGVLPRVVELSTTDVFGFAIRGGKEVDFPIFVSGILPGGVAEHNGGLRRGDQLITINGINVEHVSHETLRLLKSAMGNVKLLVRYRPNLLNELFDWIERHFEGQ